MSNLITKKQKEILDYIKVYNEIHGYSPSLVEIAGHFRLKAISTVYEHILNLKAKGYLQKEISQARSLRLVQPPNGETKMVEIPVLYSLNNRGSLTLIKSDHNVYIHPSKINPDAKYFAIRIDSDEYLARQIKNRDIIVLKETEKPAGQRIYLATLNKKSYYFGEIKYEKDKVVLEKIDANHSTSTEHFIIKGELTMLIRDMQML